MVEIPDQLACLFTGQVAEEGDSYTIEVPEEELEVGSIMAGETYRVVLLENSQPADSAEQQEEPPVKSAGSATPEPPVSTGDVREVTIEALGDQGDGIAKIERGYVLIVPGARPDDEVTVEITEVRQNVAFAEVRDQSTISDDR